MIAKIKKSLTGQNKELFFNLVGAFLVKGLGMVLSLFTMPAYIRYFDNDIILGVWFTLLSVLNWVLIFDLGIGNGLRNRLPFVLQENDTKKAKGYISAAYLSITTVVVVIGVIFLLVRNFINWNTFLNIETEIISFTVLTQSVTIIFFGILIRFILGIVTSILYALQKSAINNFNTFATTLLTFIYVVIAPSKSNQEASLIQLSYVHVIASLIPLVVCTIYVFVKPLKGMLPSPKYYSKSLAKDVLGIGVTLLWLQIIWMVLSSMHSFLITQFCGPEYVVEYNIYFRVANTIASIFVLAMSPIWSAVTKAQANKNYAWIKKLLNILMLSIMALFFVYLLLLPFMQFVFDIWLGDESIKVNYINVVIVSAYSIIYTIHSVNTSFSNGLSRFKLQKIGLTLAAIIYIPVAWLFVKWLDSWTGIIIACGVVLIPYEILQYISTIGYLNQGIKDDRAMKS